MNRKTTVIVKQTGEMEQKKEKYFDQPWASCALCTYFSSHSSHFCRSSDYCPTTSTYSSYTHIRSLWGRGEKTKLVWSAKLHSAEYWSPPYTFIQICTFFPLYTLSRILLKNVFSFVHHSVFYTHLTLKKRNQRGTSLFTQLIYVILQNKCIKDKHQHSTEFRYIFCNWKSSQTSRGSQLNQGFKYREAVWSPPHESLLFTEAPTMHGRRSTCPSATEKRKQHSQYCLTAVLTGVNMW